MKKTTMIMMGLALLTIITSGCQVVIVKNKKTQEPIMGAWVDVVNEKGESKLLGKALTGLDGSALLPAQAGKEREFIVVSKGGQSIKVQRWPEKTKMLILFEMPTESGSQKK